MPCRPPTAHLPAQKREIVNCTTRAVDKWELDHAGGFRGVNMHAGKHSTHAATRPLHENPDFRKCEMGAMGLGGLGQDHFENDAPHEKCEFYTFFRLASRSFCRSATSPRSPCSAARSHKVCPKTEINFKSTRAQMWKHKICHY